MADSGFVGVAWDVSNAASGFDDVVDGVPDGVLDVGGVAGDAGDAADAAAAASSRASLASWNTASQSGCALVLPS